MSILVIRNDDGCEEVYNRTTVFCYTKMPKEKLWEYVKALELLADDRQALFFKIDVDIFSAPKKLSNCKEWLILSIVLKASKRPFSFGILVKLFAQVFPHKMKVDFCTTNIFICSGSLDDTGGSLSADEQKAFEELAKFHKKTYSNSIKASKCFKEHVKSPEDASNLLVQLASKYGMKGGHWIFFFNRMDPSRREEAFDVLLDASLEHWGPISRFNAKLSKENFIICFGNQTTLAVKDPKLLESSAVKSEENDPEPLRVLHIIDEIYGKNPTVFNYLGVKYKPDIMSACCVQRDNLIRPTVYQANYGFYNRNFRPCSPENMRN